MGDLVYHHARLRALHGRRFDRAAYERLLALPDLPAIVTFLRDSRYGGAIARAAPAFPGSPVAQEGADLERVEEALRRHLSETLRGLIRLSAAEPWPPVERLLGYWEIQNLKTIVRGRVAGLPSEEILSALTPTGLHDEAALAELSRQPSLQALADLLVTWRDPYAVWLSDALKGYREPGDLFLVEIALDRSYFAAVLPPRRPSRISGGEEDPLTLFFSLLVEKTNWMTALKGVEGGIGPDELARYFIPGGGDSQSDLLQIAASRTLNEAVDRIRKSFDLSERLFEEGGETIPLLSRIERAADRRLLRAMRRSMRTDPLGAGCVLTVLLDQIREMTNLRMILRGRAMSIPEEAWRPLLILEE